MYVNILIINGLFCRKIALVFELRDYVWSVFYRLVFERMVYENPLCFFLFLNVVSPSFDAHFPKNAFLLRLFHYSARWSEDDVRWKKYFESY